MNFTVASHEAEILGQAGIIYAMLLGGTAIIGGILFGIRQLTLKELPDTKTTSFAAKDMADGIELNRRDTSSRLREYFATQSYTSFSNLQLLDSQRSDFATIRRNSLAAYSTAQQLAKGSL
jgi:hypothetical protein